MCCLQEKQTNKHNVQRQSFSFSQPFILNSLIEFFFFFGVCVCVVHSTGSKKKKVETGCEEQKKKKTTCGTDTKLELPYVTRYIK